VPVRTHEYTAKLTAEDNAKIFLPQIFAKARRRS
jgi:hypothetical protein